MNKKINLHQSLKKAAIALSLAASSFIALPTQAADYVIDSKGAHAFIQFKIKHMGFSWLLGDFSKFEGEFSFDEKNPDASNIQVNIDTTSIDTNHAERNKHLRSKDFLDTSKFPESKFISTSFKQTSKDKATLIGDLTLHGVTKSVTIDVDYIGQGDDPWGGYRAGFSGTTKIALKDYGIDFNLGPASKEVDLFFSIEGIRK